MKKKKVNKILTIALAFILTLGIFVQAAVSAEDNPTVARENYATILNQNVYSNLVINGVRYDGRLAYVYNASGNGRIVPVCAPYGSDLLYVGRTVILSDVTYNDGMTTFRGIRANDDRGTATTGRIASNDLLTSGTNIVNALNATWTAVTEAQFKELETESKDNLLAALIALENAGTIDNTLLTALTAISNQLTPTISPNFATGQQYDLNTGNALLNATAAKAYLVEQIYMVTQIADYNEPRITDVGRMNINIVTLILTSLKNGALSGQANEVNAVTTALENYRDALMTTIGVTSASNTNTYGRYDEGTSTYTVAGRVSLYSGGNSMRIVDSTGNSVGAYFINLAGASNIYRTIYVRPAPGVDSVILSQPGRWNTADVLLTECMGNSALAEFGATGLWEVPNDLFTNSDRPQSNNNTFAVVTMDKNTETAVAITFFVGVPNDRWTGNWADYTWRSGDWGKDKLNPIDYTTVQSKTKTDSITQIFGEGTTIEYKSGETEFFGTGTVIILPNGNRETLIVPNDLTGDGDPGIKDAARFLEHLVGNNPLEGAYEEAAKEYLNNDESAIKKLRAFLNAVMGAET